MKHVAKPVEVEAHVITDVSPAAADGSMVITLDSGKSVTIAQALTSRFVPGVGDYYVIQEDGYAYVNPKAVFERKYRPIAEEPAEYEKKLPGGKHTPGGTYLGAKLPVVDGEYPEVPAPASTDTPDVVS